MTDYAHKVAPLAVRMWLVLRSIFLLPFLFLIISCGGEDDVSKNNHKQAGNYQQPGNYQQSGNGGVGSGVSGSASGGGNEIFNGDTNNDYSSKPQTSSAPVAVQASRFLTQATFGSRLYDVNALVDQELDFAGWIDEQVKLPATYHSGVSSTTGQNGRQEAWWKVVVNSQDQLRQRMAWALSQIFVVSDIGGTLNVKPEALYNYYDMLLRNSFGNFRDLLEDVTLSLTMGYYLSLKDSQKPDSQTGSRPDENYAREVMQLFTIGLTELNIDGTDRYVNGKKAATYTQKDVEELARALTGWSSANGWRWYLDFNRPMIAYQQYHDTGSKTFLGHTLPAGQSAEKDMKDALDILFNHPNVGPFISKQLIQRLVTSNPSPGYIGRVAQKFDNNGEGVRGDLVAVLKAILLDNEARVLTENANYGKLREPILRMTHLMRAFNSNPGSYHYWKPEEQLMQAPLRSPTVFNFYSPSYSPTGEIQEKGLTAPEFQITTDSGISSVTNQLFVTALGDYWNSIVPLDISMPVSLADDVDELIGYLDLILMQGNMSESMKQILHTQFNADDTMEIEKKIRDLIYLTVTSAEYAVQR